MVRACPAMLCCANAPLQNRELLLTILCSFLMQDVSLSFVTLCWSWQSLTSMKNFLDVLPSDYNKVHCSRTAAVTTGNAPCAEGVCGRSPANWQ